jgi:Dehydratase family
MWEFRPSGGKEILASMIHPFGKFRLLLLTRLFFSRSTHRKPTCFDLNVMSMADLEPTVFELGRIVKKGLEKQGMLGWQFSTIGVSDGITMGHDGKRTSSYTIAELPF